MLAKRKKNLELLDSSHGTDPEVADWNGLVKDLRNVVPKQRDSPKNQSGEMATSLRGRIDSIEGRAEPGRRCCQETRKKSPVQGRPEDGSHRAGGEQQQRQPDRVPPHPG